MKKLKILALLLVLVCLLTACADKAEKKSRTDADKSVSESQESTQPSADGIVGNWTAQCDLTQTMADSLGGSTQLNGAFVLALRLELNADSTMKLVLDKDATEAASAEFMQSLTDLMLEQIYQAADQSEETSREEIDAQFESEYGMSAREYIESNFNFSTLLDSMGETDHAGVYRYTDGKLQLGETEADLKEDTYIAVTLDGDTLTFNQDYVDGQESDLSSLSSLGITLPLTFTRD